MVTTSRYVTWLLAGLLLLTFNPLESGAGHQSKTRTTTQPTHRHKANSTYKSSGTRYKVGEHYKSSGLPKVARSESAKKKFLRSLGYKRVPSGFEVDHIKPLSEGGSDSPSNMQLIPKSTHKQKTASERKRH